MGRKRIELVEGARYGRGMTLIAVAFDSWRKPGGQIWLFKCDLCGQTKPLLAAPVKRGVAGCGCRVRTHGALANGQRTPEYACWTCMIQRCENPKATGFERYGGRGIRVCVGWHDAAMFLVDMGNRPTDNHSIERIDNSRGYDCGKCADCVARGATPNCRWATSSEQAHNRRSSARLTANGETLCMHDWAVRLGTEDTTVWRRIHRLGWSVERAVTEPVHAHCRKNKSSDNG